MRIRLAIPDELDDQERKEALDAALESVTRSVTGLVRRGIVPTAATAIKNGVKWAPEPPGDEHFDLPTTVIKRGFGDCDDLAPFHAGSLRATGVDTKARAVVKKSGPNRWHAYVVRGDGSTEDPSKAAGMGHSVSGAGGGASPIHAPMAADGRMVLALVPGRDPRRPNAWHARCDAPDRCEPWDWSASASHPDPTQALLRTISTVRGVCGEEIDDVDLARLEAVNDLLRGGDPDEIGEELERIFGEGAAQQILGEAEDSVGFFGGLVRSISKPFAPIARGVAKGLAPFARMVEPFAKMTPAGGLVTSLSRGDPRALMAALSPVAMAHLAPKSVLNTYGGQPIDSPITPQTLQAYASMIPGGMPSMPGWAPPTMKIEPGELIQPGGDGPSFMVF